MKFKKFAVVVLVVLAALAVAPVASAQEEGPESDVIEVLDEAPAEEAEEAVVEAEILPVEEEEAEAEENGGEIGVKVGVAIVLLIAAFLYERGYEFIISQPVFEKLWPDKKAFQAWVVLLVATGAAILLKADVMQYVNVGGEPLSLDEMLAQGLSGVVVAIIAMLMHEMRRSKASF